jgi:predicted transcriptional regulator with HTH domain
MQKNVTYRLARHYQIEVLFTEISRKLPHKHKDVSQILENCTTGNRHLVMQGTRELVEKQSGLRRFNMSRYKGSGKKIKETDEQTYMTLHSGADIGEMGNVENRKQRTHNFT